MSLSIVNTQQYADRFNRVVFLFGHQNLVTLFRDQILNTGFSIRVLQALMDQVGVDTPQEVTTGFSEVLCKQPLPDSPIQSQLPPTPARSSIESRVVEVVDVRVSEDRLTFFNVSVDSALGTTKFRLSDSNPEIELEVPSYEWVILSQQSYLYDLFRGAIPPVSTGVADKLSTLRSQVRVPWVTLVPTLGENSSRWNPSFILVGLRRGELFHDDFLRNDLFTLSLAFDQKFLIPLLERYTVEGYIFSEGTVPPGMKALILDHITPLDSRKPNRGFELHPVLGVEDSAFSVIYTLDMGNGQQEQFSAEQIRLWSENGMPRLLHHNREDFWDYKDGLPIDPTIMTDFIKDLDDKQLHG